MPIYLKICPEDIAGALQEFCDRWCNVECNALFSWISNIFKKFGMVEIHFIAIFRSSTT